MSYPAHQSGGQSPAADPLRIDLPEYVLVFGDDRPPRRYEFVALGDADAAERMRRLYPGYVWALFRVAADGRRTLCCRQAVAARRWPDGPGPAH